MTYLSFEMNLTPTLLARVAARLIVLHFFVLFRLLFVSLSFSLFFFILHTFSSRRSPVKYRFTVGARGMNNGCSCLFIFVHRATATPVAG